MVTTRVATGEHCSSSTSSRSSSGGDGGDGASLLDLNDDCLEIILCKLNVLQQFQIARLHTRFKQIVQTEWRRHLADVALSAQLLQTVDCDVFVEFMRSLAPYMKRLVVRELDVARLRLLTDCVFPATTAFDFSGELGEHFPSARGSGGGGDGDDDDHDDEHDQENDHGENYDGNLTTAQHAEHFLDDDILLVQRMFPNLRALKLRGCHITGKYLADLTTLQQLSLDACQCLESEHFRDIFHSLPLQKFDIMKDCDEVNCCDLVEIKRCTTLAHIKIADYHMCFDTDIINDMLRMPQMRKLSIYSKNFVFDVIERISRLHIKTIVAFQFNGVLHNFGRFFGEIAHMRRLRQLAFHDCHWDDGDGDDEAAGIRDHMLQRISMELPELEEVHFCACQLESDAGLLHFIRNCRSLRLIDISYTRKIDDAFLWRCVDLLRKQKWRTAPLDVWVQHTGIDSEVVEDPRYVHNQRYLRIDTKKSTVDTNPPGVLKFTFEL